MIFPVLGNPLSDTSSIQSSTTSIDTGLQTSDVENTEVEHLDDYSDDSDDLYRDPEIELSATADQDSDADSTEIESQGDLDGESIDDSCTRLTSPTRIYPEDYLEDDESDRDFVFVDEEIEGPQVSRQVTSTYAELQDSATRDEVSH